MSARFDLLIDTNVIIDYAVRSRPAHADAVVLFEEAARADGVRLVVLVSSLKDAYYIMCRAYGDELTARDALRRVSKTFFVVVDLLAAYADDAFASDEPDFEDGLVRAAAERLGVHAIVTRDTLAFAGSFVKAVPPAEATAWIRQRHK